MTTFTAETKKELAVQIVKKEGVVKGWNKKFYQPGDRVEIYIHGEKIDLTETLRPMRDKKGMLSVSEIIDTYDQVRMDAYRAGLDAFLKGGDKKEAMTNFINTL